MKRVLYKDLAVNFQRLPRLPIPALDETLARYSASLAPLKKRDAVERHRAKLAAFEQSGDAARLQAELVAADAAAAASGAYPHSYIERLWDDGYLCYREPSPLNIAPAVALKPFAGTARPRSQAATAAALCHAIARWIRGALSAGIEVPPREQAAPAATDVSQLQCQFGFARVPHPLRDACEQAPLEKARHVAVLRDGQPFLLRVVADDGSPIPLAALERAFEHVLSVVPPPQDGSSAATAAVLTSGKRDEWAAALAELRRVPGNDAALRAIAESIIVVCLDRGAWGADVAAAQCAMLHGGPAECENRWYDKHQLLVSADGRVAFNFEHAFSDGATWMRWLGDVVADVNSMPSSSSSSDAAAAVALVEPLTIALGKPFSAPILAAREAMRRACDSVQLESAVLPVGKARLKQLRFSPDAFAQLAFHAAFHATAGTIAPTYESCSTAQFFHGRTETIRTATADVLAAVLALEAGTLQGSLMRAAAETHVRLAREAAAGRGVDRHLLALKALAKPSDAAAHAFFHDELYAYASTWLMSTSNVSRPFLEHFSFGPVAPNGYGIGYVVHDDAIVCGISAWAASTQTSARDFKAALATSAESLLSVLQQQQQ